MDRRVILESLAQAREQVVTSERHVQCQRTILAGLYRAGRDTTQAQQLLSQLEAAQAQHVFYRDRLEQLAKKVGQLSLGEVVATPSGAASWTQPLAHPVWDSAGTVLNTRSDVCRYILALPPDKQSRNAWLRVAGLLLEGADVARLTCQLERALLLDHKLDIL
jgi:hypothetical protein